MAIAGISGKSQSGKDTVGKIKEINHYGHGDCTYQKITVDKESILNAYSETLIS